MRDNNEQGFTTIEVLVAFIVASLGLMSFYVLAGEMSRHAVAVAELQEALAHGQSKLALMAQDAKNAAGEQQGTLDSGTHWRVAMRPLMTKHDGSKIMPTAVTYEATGKSGRTLLSLKTIIMKQVP